MIHFDYFSIFLPILYFLNGLPIPVCANERVWIRVNVSQFYWEDLKLYTSGERKIFCGNIDKKFGGRYHWRFNGTSSLPIGTQIHKHQMVFLNGGNAHRDSFVGYYDCCVRERMGNTCYRSEILLKDYPQLFGVDLTKNEDHFAVRKEGDSVLLRIVKTKQFGDVQCKLDNETAPPNIMLSRKSRKKHQRGDFYQLKIDHFEKENVGVYNCSMQLAKGVKQEKIFRLFFDSSKQVPSLCISLLSVFVVAWLYPFI